MLTQTFLRQPGREVKAFHGQLIIIEDHPLVAKSCSNAYRFLSTVSTTANVESSKGKKNKSEDGIVQEQNVSNA